MSPARRAVAGRMHQPARAPWGQGRATRFGLSSVAKNRWAQASGGDVSLGEVAALEANLSRLDTEIEGLKILLPGVGSELRVKP